MEHQAALESLLEVYEALRKAVRAQLDGTGSLSMHRGRTDVQVRAIREALEVLAAETSARTETSFQQSAEQTPKSTTPTNAESRDASVLKGHVQVFQALWGHILEEVVLCLSQLDVPEVAGLLKCAQEGHADFLHKIRWADIGGPSEDNQKQGELARGWSQPAKQPPGSLQLVIPSLPESPQQGGEPWSISASPQTTPSQRMLLLLPHPPQARKRLEEGATTEAAQASYDAPIGAPHTERHADGIEQVGGGSVEPLHHAHTMSALASSKPEETPKRQLNRSASTLSSLAEEAPKKTPPKASKGERRSTVAMQSPKSASEYMWGSFRRLLHTASNPAELPPPDAYEAGASLLRGSSGLSRGGEGRSRAATVDGRSPRGREQEPGYLRPTSSSAHKIELERGRSRSSAWGADSPLPRVSPKLDSPFASPRPAIPQEWESFEEEALPAPSLQGEAGWSPAATPTAAKALAQRGRREPAAELTSPGSKPPAETEKQEAPAGSLVVAASETLETIDCSNWENEGLLVAVPTTAGEEAPSSGVTGNQEDETEQGLGSREFEDAAETSIFEGESRDQAGTSPEEEQQSNGSEMDNATVPTCAQRILALRNALWQSNRDCLADSATAPRGSRESAGLDKRSSQTRAEIIENAGQLRSQRRGPAVRGGGLRSPPAQAVLQGGALVRQLSLKELRLLMQDVYASKEKCDARCLQCGLPKESLEAHLYRFLTQRFGLRALIAEWLGAVLTAVAAFSHVDAQTDIFGKILLNELAQDCRQLYSHLRKSLEQAVADQMRAKHPYAPVDDIASLVAAAMAGHVTAQDARELVCALFPSHDSQAILGKLAQQLEAAQSTPQKSSRPASHRRQLRRRSYARSKGATNRVAMADLVELLLRYQSDVRWLALQPLVALFPSYTEGGPALPSDAALVALLHAFHPAADEADVRRVLGWAQQIAGEGPITFSDTVAILTRAAGAMGTR